MRNKKPKTIEDLVKILKVREEMIRDRFKVKEIGIFGSYVRGEQKRKSDIDILVDFEIDGLTFDNYMDLKFHLEEIFSTNVDLAIKDSIKESFKEFVLQR